MAKRSAEKRKPTPFGPTEDALRELVRQGERNIESQLEAAKEQDEKNRHLITLAAGVFAVAVALSSAVASDLKDWLVLPFVGLMLLALFATLGGIALLARAYVGLGKNQANVFHAGWNPATLNEAAAAGDPLTEVHLSTLAGVEKWTAKNTAQLERTSRLRRTAAKLLLFGAILLILAYAYALVAASFSHASEGQAQGPGIAASREGAGQAPAQGERSRPGGMDLLGRQQGRRAGLAWIPRAWGVV